MSKHLKSLPIIILMTTLAVTSGCTKEESSEGDGGNNGGGGGSTRSGSLSSQCGTVVGGELVNPASAGDGLSGSVTVLGSNLLSLQLASGPLLIKLHGLGTISNSSAANSARAALGRLASEGSATFIPADANCTTSVAGGGVGSIGQLFSPSGKNYSETLLSAGLSNVTSDPCGGSLLTSCYRALQEEAESKFAGEIGRLLWKPVSDSNGRLAIHTGPVGTTVVVNGETGTSQGPGNGYGSLARFTKAGCGYGGNVRVQIFNKNGAAYTFNGATSITIPNGCNRYCLEGSSFEQCVKR